MSGLDEFFERQARRAASYLSRRGFISRLGQAMLFTAVVVPVLPFRRASSADSTAGAGNAADDPTKCDYWRHCAIDGNLCSCCGGSSSTCPPGTKPSTVSWVGTCHNPADGRDYVISYNDCCGNTGCPHCLCNNNVGERPGYRMGLFNDANWCMGNAEASVTCTTAVVIGHK